MATVRQTVQPGTTTKLRVEVETSPVETGRAGAFSLKEAIITVGSVVTDLKAGGLAMPAMVELAFAVSPAVTASVTAAPTFAAASGPDEEDCWTLTVDSSTAFDDTDFIRAKDQPDGQGQVYAVIDKPSSTRLRIHGKTGGCDITNGDTIEACEPAGVYCGSFPLVIDDYLDSGHVDAQLRFIVQTTDTGDAPVFDAVETLVWTFDLVLDVGSRQYRAG